MVSTEDSERGYSVGRGNWEAFDLQLEVVNKAAGLWREKLSGIDKPWLCWNVQSDWCYVQQGLVAGAGWTPVVGFDPRVGAPNTIADAIVLDFNAELQLPVLYPHFILEFVYLFANKLAFWHSDLLLTERDMENFAGSFAKLNDGEMSAVRSPSGWRSWLPKREARYWELLGCTTGAASKSQFDHGCGWWRNFYYHPNSKKLNPDRYHWEYGCGIRHWQTQHGGKIHAISENRVDYGHFTRIGQQDYRASEKNNIFRNLNKDIQSNFDLHQCAESLNLLHLMPR